MINKVIMVGRLTHDPELRRTAGGTAITSFNVATNRSWKGNDGNWQEKTTFSSWKLWNGVGENFAKNAHKGDLVYLEGEYGLNEWEDNEGEKRSRPEFTGFTVRILSKAGAGSKSVGEANDEAPTKSAPKKRGRPSAKAEPKLEPVDSDDSEDDSDIPF